MDTSFLNYINWLAVICGALGCFALGAIWYSKVLFAKKWIALTKVDAKNPDAYKGMGAILFSSFLLMFLTSLGIAILRNRLDISGYISGIKLGLVTGFFFGASAISISYLYEKRSMGLHFINGLYTIIGNIIAAVIICCWV
jgi:hypothetical protein